MNEYVSHLVEIILRSICIRKLELLLKSVLPAKARVRNPTPGHV